jgi:hypothetical protein
VTAALMVRVGAMAVHVTVTVTFAVMVPAALPLGVQVCPEGGVATVTEYVAPLAYRLENVCVASVLNVSWLPRLSCKTSVPERPVTVPPRVNVGGGGGGVELELPELPPHPEQASNATTVKTSRDDFITFTHSIAFAKIKITFHRNQNAAPPAES